MEGVTDSAFRRMAKFFGANVVYTEFVAAEAVVHGGERIRRELRFQADEQPIVAQIFGKDVATFRDAAAIIERLGFAGLDINFGCPARKVVRSGAGVSLMRDPRFCRQLIESVLNVIHIPLSIKVRASIRRERREVDPGDNRRVTALDLVHEIADLPVSAIMVHGRSFEGGFDGPIDVEMIRAVKRAFPGKVLANGGITSPADAIGLLDATGADGVGLARGALGRPWIFADIRTRLNGAEPRFRTWLEHIDDIERHAQWAHEAKGPWGIVEFRKHLAWYVRSTPGAAQIRRSLATLNTLDDVKQALRRAAS